jgi:hypothetical protein
VGRRGRDYEMNVSKIEKALNAPGKMEMPKMNGIEGTAEYTQLHWTQISLSSLNRIA